MLLSASERRVWFLFAVFAVLLTSCTDRPDTDLAQSSGPGWEVLGYERQAATSSLAAIVTSDRALDAAWSEGSFATAKPVLDFSDQVGLILTPGFSGSCPDVVFQDLVIGENQVFGVFDFPSDAPVCTADFNPISFFFAVDRAALPKRFTLSVMEGSECYSCRLKVDLTDETSLEAELWGGPLTVEAEGSAPKDNHVNVVRMLTDAGDVGAFLFQPEDWDNPDVATRSVGSLRSIERIDGFVSACEGNLCTEDACDVADCDGLRPLGEICSVSPEPKLQPQVLVVTFDGDTCTMDVRVNQEP